MVSAFQFWDSEIQNYLIKFGKVVLGGDDAQTF